MGIVPSPAALPSPDAARRIDNKCEEETETVLDNLTLLALFIIVVWLATLAFYFYTSRQHNDIREELDEVRALLDEGEGAQEKRAH